MKREGRQHGMVRCFEILRPPFNPKSRIINQFSSPPTAGFYTKVSSKPTNHSKFTGKCGKPRCFRCHTHPVCNSKDKAKGTQKLKSYDVSMNRRGWRVVDKGLGLNYSGISATGILQQLSGSYRDDMGDDYEDDEEGGDEEQSPYLDGLVAPECDIKEPETETEEVGPSQIDIEDDGEESTYLDGLIAPPECDVKEPETETEEVSPSQIAVEDDGDDDVDDDMGFYTVEFMWEIVGDDGENWCLVGEK